MWSSRARTGIACFLFASFSDNGEDRQMAFTDKDVREIVTAFERDRKAGKRTGSPTLTWSGE